MDFIHEQFKFLENFIQDRQDICTTQSYDVSGSGKKPTHKYLLCKAELDKGRDGHRK